MVKCWTLGKEISVHDSQELRDRINNCRIFIEALCRSLTTLKDKPKQMSSCGIKFPIKLFGNRGSTVVKALCYKSEGRWFDPSWCQLIFGDRGGTVFKVLCYKLEGRWFDPSWFQLNLGTAAAQWLRCCATNQKVAGSIPAGVSGFLGTAVAQCLRRCATNRKVAGSIPAGVSGIWRPR